MIWKPVLQRGDVFAHNLEHSLRDLFRNLWASKSIKHDLPNLETTMKMNLPQPQAGSSNISELSRRRSKAHRASYLWRRILDREFTIRLGEGIRYVNGTCRRANAVAVCQRAWGNPHFCSIEMIQLWKILLHFASALEVKIFGTIATPVVHRSDLIVCNIFSKRFV